MEMVTVKSEANPEKRHLNIADIEVPTGKCVKRSRREPVAAVTSYDHNQKEQQQQQPQQQQGLEQAPSGTSTTVKRSSRFRGVSRHKWTGRFEAHLWDKGTWNVTQKKKGKQVYLGAYDEEESAARAYDLAAIKYWGVTTFTNFPVSDYERENEIMQNVTKEEYLASLRRRSSGFSRGVSKYRGVARHHHNGRWEARIGRVFGNKYLYLGTYSTQEEAAHAYDIAAIEYRGINAVTNFDLSTYIRWLRQGANTVVTTQEPLTYVESLAVPVSPNLIPDEETALPFFHTNSFLTDDLGSPEKQDIFQRKKPSSPSALGLLLRSSIFRELVDKYLNAIVDENEPQTGSDDEYGGIFYEGIGDIPYASSNNGDTLPNITLEEESASPSYNQTRQSLWNDVLSMSSVQ